MLKVPFPQTSAVTEGDKSLEWSPPTVGGCDQFSGPSAGVRSIADQAVMWGSEDVKKKHGFFYAFVLAPAWLLTFGKVNPGPQTDFF